MAKVEVREDGSEVVRYDFEDYAACSRKRCPSTERFTVPRRTSTSSQSSCQWSSTGSVDRRNRHQVQGDPHRESRRPPEDYPDFQRNLPGGLGRQRLCHLQRQCCHPGCVGSSGHLRDHSEGYDQGLVLRVRQDRKCQLIPRAFAAAVFSRQRCFFCPPSYHGISRSYLSRMTRRFSSACSTESSRLLSWRK